MGRQRRGRTAVLVVLTVFASLLGSASTVTALQGSGAGEGSGAFPDTAAGAYYAESVAQLSSGACSLARAATRVSVPTCR